MRKTTLSIVVTIFVILFSIQSAALSTVYKDSDTGAEFVIPENWAEAVFNEEREILDAKFVPVYSETPIINYGSVDVWAQLPISEKVGLSRVDMDNNTLTVEELKDLLDSDIAEVTQVTYNGKTYFKMELDYTYETAGAIINLDMTQLIYIKDGWMYLFQFVSTGNSDLYSDFESLVKSVIYPPDEMTLFKGLVANTLALLIMGALCMIPIAIYRYIIRRKVLDDRTARKATIIYAACMIAVAIIPGITYGVLLVAIIAVVLFSFLNYVVLTAGQDELECEDINVYENEPPKPYTIKGNYCRVCGTALPKDSKFCHICGTRKL